MPQRRHTCWWPVFEETQPLSSWWLQLSWCYLAKQWLRDTAQWCSSREKTLCPLPYFHLHAEAEPSPFSVFLSDSSLGNPCHVMGQNSTSIGPGLAFRHVLLSKSLLGLRRLWLWESEEEDVSGRCYGSHLNGKNQLTGKDPDAEKDWGQEKKGTTEDEMVGWHQWLNGREFDQASGDVEGQGSLACCSPWGRKDSDPMEQLNRLNLKMWFYFTDYIRTYVSKVRVNPL